VSTTSATGHPGEVRLPASIAIAVAIALYALLPNRLVIGPRFLVPALELALLIPVVIVNPGRMTQENSVLRRLSIGLILVIAATNTAALGLLLHELLTASGKTVGSSLILGAGQIWATNIILYGIVFWELDLGGPVLRTQRLRKNLPAPDFRFPQDEPWIPGFLDYLYVSLTNSTAFSPTDTMPLTARAKILMGVEGVSAMLTMVLVIARGVNLLNG
jgi:hypothetical protein